MGTKNRPGPFDCYANAAPDEPMFVLLGRDKHAAALVNLWAAMRLLDGEDVSKVDEAVTTANSMVEWLADHKHIDPAGIRALAEGLAQLANECGARVSIEPFVTTPLEPSGYTYRVMVWPAR